MDARPIVVGVDSCSGTSYAIAWAASECELRAVPLLLVHAVEHTDTDLAESMQQLSHTQRDASAQLVLDASLDAARQAYPGLEIDGQLRHGAPAHALIQASGDAALVVLGTNGSDDIATSILGTVGRRVAAHCLSPVVIAPQTQVSAREHHDSPIVVGLAPTPAGRLALQVALSEARLRSCGVIAVRAGSHDTMGGAAHLKAAVAETHPGLRFEVILTDTAPAEALLAEAKHAALLVMGCHHHSEEWSSRLGEVTAAVLPQLRCPILLAGQRH